MCAHMLSHVQIFANPYSSVQVAQELLHAQGQGWWPRRATPRLRSGAAAQAQEGQEVLHVQGQEGWP